MIVCASCNPLPDNCTDCMLDELLRALSVSVSVPVNTPLCIGVNAIAIRHWPPDDKFVLELQSVPPEDPWVKFAVIARFDTVNGWFPSLETVIA